MNINESYFEKRLKKLEISKNRNIISSRDIEGNNINSLFFTETKAGDIKIHYHNLEGEIEYYNIDKGDPKEFYRLRYKNSKESGKYFQPAGTETIPFITPLIIKMYKEKKKIKNLVITEGEFKSFALNNFDVPCIGIGGIHNFKNKDKDRLHEYILKIIDLCQVENVILLLDADCVKVDWIENKDLSKRLNSFYICVDIFNELLKPYNINLYFSHIIKESEFKGIDDLLYNGISDKQKIINELNNLIEGVESRQYIITYKITGKSSYLIQKIFYLDSVQNFFDNHIKLLEDKEFVYKNETYYLNEKGKLSVSWKGEQNYFIRIGCDYYKRVAEKSPKGHTEIVLKKWNIGEINKDYIRWFR